MKFGNKFWQQAMCTPASKGFNRSPEAIYDLVMPPNTEGKITLENSCGTSLVPFAIKWDEPDTCPKEANAIGVRECEIADKQNHVSITNIRKENTYLVGVEGHQGAAGNFRLTIECSVYR